MTSDRREGKMNYDLLRLLQKISEAGGDIGIQGGVAFLECRPDRMSAMNKLADEFEAHKAAIVDLFGPGDGIIEAAELADQLSALAADTLSRWWPGVVRTKQKRICGE
jgi:hypothetical protein